MANQIGVESVVDINERCPCGHSAHQHYEFESQCLVKGCDCPEFGEPVENWEEYTKVYFTEGPCGHCGYE